MKPKRSINAVLPTELEKRTLGGLAEGESAWTVPWAMQVDQKGRCWLQPDYSTYDEPGGTVQMQVTRRADGYHVELPADRQFMRGTVAGGMIPVLSIERSS